MMSPRSTAVRRYVLGYAIALVLTICTYLVATSGAELTRDLILMLGLLASAQLIVQALYFLHIGNDARPRWRTISFGVTVMVLLFIVGGSIWVMNNLDYNMMSHDAQQRMIDDEGLRH